MITQELVNNYFTYKGGELFHNRNISQIKKGDKAGTTLDNGYVKIYINGKPYAGHRIVFLMLNGFLPEFIDHVDGNRSNNRIENLRACTRSQNNQNAKINRRNTSGVKGVSWRKDTSCWVARVQCDGKRKFLGRFCSIVDAKRAIHKHRKEVHGNFANNG